MDNANPVQPLQNPGEQSQPSVLDRVFARTGASTEEELPVLTDNVRVETLTKCINPSCTGLDKELPEDLLCPTCGFNARERF